MLPACRQLAGRAGQKIAVGPGGARFGIASAGRRLVTGKFITAGSNGDLSGLLEVLAPDARGGVDLGPGVTGFSGVFEGAKGVAGNLRQGTSSSPLTGSTESARGNSTAYASAHAA